MVWYGGVYMVSQAYLVCTLLDIILSSIITLTVQFSSVHQSSVQTPYGRWHDFKIHTIKPHRLPLVRLCPRPWGSVNAGASLVQIMKAAAATGRFPRLEISQTL